MKSLLYFVGGVGMVAAMFAWKAKQAQALKAQPVEELAHRLQDAWADHHTVA